MYGTGSNPFRGKTDPDSTKLPDSGSATEAEKTIWPGNPSAGKLRTVPLYLY